MTREDVINQFKKSIVLCEANGTCLLEDNIVLKAFNDYADFVENRRCENCKYWMYPTLETSTKTCVFDLIEHNYEGSDFYCSKWEDK